MKIIFVVKSLSGRGGTERVVSLLSNLFVEKLGIELIIVNQDVADNLSASFYINNNVKVTKLGCGIIFFYRLQKLINSENPDYVFFHNMGKLSIMSSITLSKGNSLFYSIEHTSFLGKDNIINIFSKFLYSKFDKVIVLTDKDRDFYSTFHNNVIKIPNLSPYKNDEFYYNLNSKRIIAIGRLSKEKNFTALISAWALVQKVIPDWILEIYGDGEQRESLNSLISEMNLNNISLKGISLEPSLLYKNSSFIVMSSLYEGLPMTLIEAQTFGLPAISFNCPFGPAEIICEGAGILVENQNVKKLAEAIQLLCQDPKLRYSMAKNSFSASYRFTSESILNAWKNILTDK